MHGRRVAAVAALALALAACSSSPGPLDTLAGSPAPGQASGTPGGAQGATQGGTQNGAPPEASGAGLKTGDAAVVVWCDRRKDDKGGYGDYTQTVTVGSYAMQGGANLDHRVFLLPSKAESAGVCRNADPVLAGIDDMATDTMRQSFNRDFSLLAGTVPGPGGTGTVATAFKGPDGPLPRKQDSGYASAPKDTHPLFQPGTSTLWFSTVDKQVVTLDAAKSEADPVKRATAGRSPFVLAGDRPWTVLPATVGDDATAVNPSGTVAVSGSRYSTTLLLWRPEEVKEGLDYLNSPHEVRLPDSTFKDPATPHRCAPQVWSDDSSLLCLTTTSLLRVRFSPDLEQVAGVDTLVPETDRKNRDVVLSPDRKSLAFLSFQGTVGSLYRLDLTTPGAQPAKVADIPASTPSASEKSVLRLVAWQ
ncbi:hypothetical protein KSE_31920 [Kitasatospora setae KM-6054]|uniref:Lipoprotein n=1 Tax=Kitasatospora setae (strain ATCC 33774 / DSM 43861 / JCM 3304 / KCC A-0304 / NBRC 14216 / KM-6054) TaxID=452652 RepID=E4NCS1_KITSK|nr:hypothetical protein KSE_31920 [Kitasatospora setae KM-6054]